MSLKKKLMAALMAAVSDENDNRKRFEIKFGLSVLEVPKGATKGFFREGGMVTRVIPATNIAEAIRKASARLGEEIYLRQYLVEILRVRETTEPVFLGPMNLKYFASRLPEDY